MRGTPIKLPPCGMFVGSGIYAMSADYLLSVMHAHQTWAVQSFTPAEMIEKIVADNQGNLAQFWGYARGYSAQTIAEWIYALDEIGIHVPPPDWEHGRHLHWQECPEIAAHPERRGAGALRFIRAAAAKGIYTTLLYTDAHAQWPPRYQAAGEYYLGYDFGERFTFALDEASLKGRRLADVTLVTLADDLMARVRAHVDERHAAGWGNIMATSGSFHLDYEIAAGADIPVVEDYAFCHLHLASALSRGLYHQHGLPLWGSHLAHEHYSWLPLASPHKFPLLRAGMYLKYLAGSKMIINESGNWYVEASLCEDSPKHEFPAVPLTTKDVAWSGRQPMKFAPYIAAARQHYDKVNYGSDVCRRYRRVISDFYDFVKANGTPAGQPETTLAIAKGNYDLAHARFMPNYALAGAYALADANPAWYEGPPERGWETVRQVFYPLRPVLGPYPNHFLSGSPWGMVDVVSFAADQISAAALARYRTLLFAGWNTASEHQYRLLLDYVRAGGTLFLGIPHLSTNVRRNYATYGVDELVHGGDVAELCGARIRGPGARYYWATAPRDSDVLGFRFPRRFGIMATRMGDVELTDPTAEVLVVDDEQARPLLWRRRCGAGQVYFLNSWDYPGALSSDDGPGGLVGSPGLIGYVFRHLAQATRGTFWITDDGADPGPACDHISYSFFPDAGRVCLFNSDLDHAQRFHLHRAAGSEPLELAPGEFRMLDSATLAVVARSLA